MPKHSTEQIQTTRAHTTKVLWAYVICGYAVLLGAAYFDNIRGPLLPVISQQLGLMHSVTSWFLIIGHIAAIICTYSIARALNRFTERAVTITVCLFGVAAGLAAFGVHNLTTLMLFAIVIGATNSSMGTICNVLVIEGTPVAKQGRMLSGLHTMYGVGSLFAASVVAETLRQGVSWPLTVIAPTPLIIAFVIFLRLRLKPISHGEIRREARVGWPTVFQWIIIVLFALYVGGEVISSMWLSTYLVEQYHLDAATAASYVMGFFAVLALARFGCFLFIRPQWEKRVIIASLVIPIIAFAIGLYGSQAWAFILVGLLGPFYPLFLARISRNFPHQWRSLTVTVIIAMQTVLILSHLTLGRIADLLTIGKAYTLAPLLLIVTLALFMLYLRFETQHLRRHPI